MFKKKTQQQMLEESLTKVIGDKITKELEVFMKTFDLVARNIVRDEFKKLTQNEQNN